MKQPNQFFPLRFHPVALEATAAASPCTRVQPDPILGKLPSWVGHNISTGCDQRRVNPPSLTCTVQPPHSLTGFYHLSSPFSGTLWNGVFLDIQTLSLKDHSLFDAFGWRLRRVCGHEFDHLKVNPDWSNPDSRWWGWSEDCEDTIGLTDSFIIQLKTFLFLSSLLDHLFTDTVLLLISATFSL